MKRLGLMFLLLGMNYLHASSDNSVIYTHTKKCEKNCNNPGNCNNNNDNDDNHIQDLLLEAFVAQFTEPYKVSQITKVPKIIKVPKKSVDKNFGAGFKKGFFYKKSSKK